MLAKKSCIPFIVHEVFVFRLTNVCVIPPCPPEFARAVATESFAYRLELQFLADIFLSRVGFSTPYARRIS